MYIHSLGNSSTLYHKYIRKSSLVKTVTKIIQTDHRRRSKVDCYVFW